MPEECRRRRRRTTDLRGGERVEEALEEGVHAGDGLWLSVQRPCSMARVAVWRSQRAAIESVALPPMIAAKLPASRANSARQMPGRDEIGRASGREKVCQYVELSVGAVS